MFFRLQVRYSEKTLKVIVTDVNDNAPTFPSDTLTVQAAESIATGHLAYTLAASDPDEGVNAEVEYSIVDGNTQGYFVLSSSGNLTINKSIDLEQETLPILNHQLLVLARDKGTPPLSTNVTLNITVTPVNEFTPVLNHSSSMNWSYPENVNPGAGVVVIDVNATDQDYGIQGEVTYSIKSGKHFVPFEHKTQICC